MEFISGIWDRTYFNYYSFASLLASIFVFLLGLFLITLPKKSRSTFHLGMAFLFFTPFYLAYCITAFYYHPDAALHRWLTVLFILPAVAHLIQWVFAFPEDSHPRVAKGFLIAQWIIAMGVTAYFLSETWSADRVFFFSGHYWDFDAQFQSRIVAYFILGYVFCLIGVGSWKAILTNTRDRWALVFIVIVFFIAATVPATTNQLSRDGALDRGVHQTAMVLLLVTAFFLVVMIYINCTRDRTTFMVKIVGISMVTFLLSMQFLGFYETRGVERNYDALRIENMGRVLEGGSRNETIEYILKYDLETGKHSFDYEAEDLKVDFARHYQELANTAIYEDLRNLPADDFQAALRNYLEDTPPYFAGYRQALMTFLLQPEVQAGQISGPELKERLFEKIDELNTLTLVNFNQIGALSDHTFKERLLARLDGVSANSEFAPFKDAILSRARDSFSGGTELKKEILPFISPLQPARARHYRRNEGEARGDFKHYVAYMQYNPKARTVSEVGFDYVAYRKFLHPSALSQTLILFFVVFAVLSIFPLFFRGSLLNPLNMLLEGVRDVNSGNLDVKVPIKVEDEIGYLSESFNNMVASIREAKDQLQDYAHNLEDKVKVRTAELNRTLEEVQKLKEQQDGDYFLTSLLQKPLNYNANKSETAPTDFLIIQKKKFRFRNKQSDLGGDICITGNLRLGAPDDFRRYIFALNGDAMGKSMQGAGGSLVMGVVVNAILARSARDNRIVNKTPEQWLSDTYQEIHGVFLAFNGSMVISCTVAIIDEETGEMWYFNAEHPYQVLYRNGKATFLEEELQLRKLGLESEIPFKVHRFQLEPGDTLIMGSDGRDDIDLSPLEPIRNINEDEFLFLKHVEEAEGQLEGIVERVTRLGALTDDLSLLRLAFHAQGARKLSRGTEILDDETSENRVIIDIDVEPETNIKNKDKKFDDLFNEGRRLTKAGRNSEALELLRQAYALRRDVPALNKTLAVLTFKEKDYKTAVEILGKYLEHDPAIEDFWLYLSIAHKRNGNNDLALDAANRLYDMNPGRIPNLIQLADLYQKNGDIDRARGYIDNVLEKDPNNRQAQSLLTTIS